MKESTQEVLRRLNTISEEINAVLRRLEIMQKKKLELLMKIEENQEHLISLLLSEEELLNTTLQCLIKELRDILYTFTIVKEEKEQEEKELVQLDGRKKLNIAWNF